MNNDIRNALLDLFSVCLEVNGAGRYHARMEFAPHCEHLQVYVLPADTDYSDVMDRQYALYEDTYISRELGGSPKRVVKSLHALAGRVNEFLLPAQEEAA